MRYKEFKNAVEDWGRKYHYKPVIKDDLDCIYMMLRCKERVSKVFHIDKSERFVVYLNWEFYRNLSDDEKRDLFKIVTELASTKPEEREDKEKNIDLTICSLKEIQTEVEDVMNRIEEMQEGSRNLRNALEDMIIYSEERKNKEDVKMDRDIKFRAWHRATKKMYEVAQTDFYHERVGYLFVDPISQSEVIGYVDFSDVELMQFTGFKDNNGVEIYEGDTVESYMDNGYEYGMLAGVVEFVDGCYFANNTLLTDLLDYIQVIGNKYEIKGN